MCPLVMHQELGCLPMAQEGSQQLGASLSRGCGLRARAGAHRIVSSGPAPQCAALFWSWKCPDLTGAPPPQLQAPRKLSPTAPPPQRASLTMVLLQGLSFLMHRVLYICGIYYTHILPNG